MPVIVLVGTVVSITISLLSARFCALTAVPADTLPAGSPTAAILVIVLNRPMLVAVPALAPVTVSVTAVPVASVPTTVNSIAESFPADKIVTFCATALVTDPPEAKAPAIVKLPLFPTAAATEIPSGSAAIEEGSEVSLRVLPA